MSSAAASFDVAGAQKAGYSDDEILQHLKSSGSFDVDGAMKAGYKPAEILAHFQQPQQPPVDATQQARKSVSMPAGATPPELGGPTDFLGRVGQRIQSNMEMIPHTLDMAIGAQQPHPGEAQAAKQTVSGNATTPLGKAANAALVAPRALYSMGKDYLQHPSNAVGDLVTALPELAEHGLPANKQFGTRPPAPPPEVATQLTPEQQTSYTAALDKENLRMSGQLAKQQAADAIASQQRNISERLQQNVQQTHEAVRSGLNQRWDALRDKVGDTPVATRPVLDAIEKSRQMLAGTPADLKVFSDIVRNLDQRGAEGISEEAFVRAQAGDNSAIPSLVSQRAGLEPTPAAEGIPFQDARTQYSALGDQWSNADGNLRRALRNVYDAYGKSIQGAAEEAGAGGEYSDLKRDWSQYVNDWQDRTPLNKVLNAPHPAYVTPIAKGIGSDLLSQQLARYQQAGADPGIVAEMQRVTRQAKAPTLKPVPVPPAPAPEPSLTQRVLSHIPRVVGKVAGGTLGSAVGHPLIGYSIGGEIGSEVGKKLMSKPPLPPVPTTPEQYTRTILAAKEGELTPGEASRRIARGGGSSKVKPLPPPP